MSYSQKLRKKVLEALKSGISKTQVSKKFRIPRPTLYRWIEEDAPTPPIVLSRFNLKKLLEERQSLTVENEILHKAGCSEISPLKTRQEAFLRLCDKYPLKTLARILGLSVGNAHYLRDHKVSVKQSEIKDTELETLILEAFRQNRECYGKRRIQAVLARAGVNISERRISRLMKKLKLIPRHVTYRWERSSPRRAYYPNRLKRKFTQEAPNRAWTSDCTYIRVKGVWYFACAIIDLFSRRIVGWGLSDRKTAEFISSVFKRAYIDRGSPQNLLFHADQGSEFTEFLFKEWARNQGVILSYSKPGSPIDNAVSESFFSTAKKEEIRHENYESEEILFAKLAEYIAWYNSKRLHSKNGQRSPQEAEESFFEGCMKIVD